MRQKNQITLLRFFTGSVIIMLTGLLSLSACQKDNHKEYNIPVAKSDMEKAATILNAELNCRDLETMNEEDAADLKIDDGNKLIILQLKPNETDINIPSPGNACIINSSFGVVIKDPASSAVLLLPRKDRESQEKFEAVQAMFNHSHTASVEGTTLVNINS